MVANITHRGENTGLRLLSRRRLEVTIASGISLSFVQFDHCPFF